MYKIGVIGDYDSIYGFATLGIDTHPVDASGAGAKIKELIAGDYRVIYITEALASEIQDELEKYAEEITPALILIPGITGNTGDGIANVKASVEKAVGSDILFGEE